MRTSCYACVAGSICDGTSVSVACLAGNFAQTGSSACSKCGEDHKYSATGAGVCSLCLAGSITSGGAGSTDRAICAKCLAGFSCDGTSVASQCPGT